MIITKKIPSIFDVVAMEPHLVFAKLVGRITRDILGVGHKNHREVKNRRGDKVFFYQLVEIVDGEFVVYV